MRAKELEAYEIRYTGTLITPDDPCETPDACTCTNVYGEWSEHGYGQTMATGWVIPSWSLFEVHEDRPSEPSDVIDLEDPYDLEDLHDRYDGDLEAMLRDRVSDVIGVIDHETGDGTYYGSTEHTDYRTGETVILAAHVDKVAPIDPVCPSCEKYDGDHNHLRLKGATI